MRSTRSARLSELIAQKADVSVDELQADETLEDTGLDSIAIMEIAVFVKREYGIESAEERLSPDQTVAQAIECLCGVAD